MKSTWSVALAAALAVALTCAGAHAQQLKPNPKANMPAKATLGAQPAAPSAAPADQSTTTTITIITTTTPQQGAGVPNTDPRLADPNRDRLMQDSQRVADDVRRGDTDTLKRDQQQLVDDLKQKADGMRNGTQ